MACPRCMEASGLCKECEEYLYGPQGGEVVAKKAECWNIPTRDGLPALIVVQESGCRPYVVGDAGPRILTNEEQFRLQQFIADLRRTL